MQTMDKGDDSKDNARDQVKIDAIRSGKLTLRGAMHGVFQNSGMMIISCQWY
jgi:hypothetical protein